MARGVQASDTLPTHSAENVRIAHRFVAGGLGDMTATFVSHPADVLKVRLQLTGQFDALKRTVTLKDYLVASRKLLLEEGVRGGLYGGLSAALFRHATFSSFRHGLYAVFEQQCISREVQMTLWMRIACAMSAGIIAASCSNPCDVVLVRMQADGHYPSSQRRNYRHVLDGFARVCRDEGWATLWRGCGPSVLRGGLITSSQIASFEQAKEMLTQCGMTSGLNLELGAAICSATIACIVTSPVDVLKTRVMAMRRDGGVRGPIDCLLQTIRSEGCLGFYKGLSATFLRLWPHTVALWMVQGRIRNGLSDLDVWLDHNHWLKLRQKS